MMNELCYEYRKKIYKSGYLIDSTELIGWMPHKKSKMKAAPFRTQGVGTTTTRTT